MPRFASRTNGALKRERGKRRKSYGDYYSQWSKQLYASHELQSDADQYTRCHLCQEPYPVGDYHCMVCHTSYEKSERDAYERCRLRCADKPAIVRFSDHSAAFRAVKALIFDVECAIPLEAVRSDEAEADRPAWSEKLKFTDSAKALGGMILDLERKQDKDWLKPDFDFRSWRDRMPSCDTPLKLFQQLLQLDKNIHYHPPVKQPRKQSPPRSWQTQARALDRLDLLARASFALWSCPLLPPFPCWKSERPIPCFKLPSLPSLPARYSHTSE
eukprot:CAMPEP_0114492924 /NCGR_PEP_ID=MMETSP0109-20121206/3827_1 /TAXON_ID=29199 /ORGANISM="Chlorarachnion reptans, Strain CCCM449" /LENGTH=271 /DNA_ID=CAMNT_0001669825 /DNA_START=10 /DNA_END=825 /DNA_ORIENTATION=-